MFGSKRRPASTQAVSRKVEGIEPRNEVNRKDDGVRCAEVNTGATVKGDVVNASSGSETMACVTLRLHGNPGDPAAAFGATTQRSKEERDREYAQQPRKGRKAKQQQGVGSSHSTSEGGQCRWREGGDRWSSRVGKHRPHREAEKRWPRNCSASGRSNRARMIVWGAVCVNCARTVLRGAGSNW